MIDLVLTESELRLFHELGLFPSSEDYSRSGKYSLTILEAEAVREAVATELMRSGFNAEWEPTERGLLLEAIIDKIGPLESN
jgi:hypothetical protein